MDRFGKPDGKVCQEWRDAISAMVDGELSPSEQQRLWRHLQTCPNCRQHYRQLQAVRGRIQKANWASLWMKAIRENRRLKRFLFVAIFATAILSAWVTSGLVGHLRNPPLMTPTSAVGILRYHLHNPFEWTFNPTCPESCRCMADKAEVVPVRLKLPSKSQAWERMGICECLGEPVAVYLATIEGQPVMLINFNTKLLPLKSEEGTLVRWVDRNLHCYIISDSHLLLWQEGQQGYALIVPHGKVNPINLLPHLTLVGDEKR
ncbi:MAG: anti-sigma factor family protein [Armatimonadota bacterium]